MKKLGEIMHEGFLFTVPKDASVAEAVRVMAENNVGIVTVLQNDRLVGVFSERDLLRRVIHKGLEPGATCVEDVMTRDLVVASEDEDYHSAMRTMDQANIRHLPIVRENKVICMLSIRDLIRVDMQRMGEELRFLHEYLYFVPPSPAKQS